MSSAAEAAKARGNEYFKKKKFDAAIEAYTEAITMDPRCPIYYSNRAFAHYKKDPLGRAANIESDCRKCLELDPRSSKGNYYLGKVLSARGEYSEGLRHFQRAYDIQPPFKDEVLRALWQCKKELWLSNQPASDTYQLVLQSLDLQLEHALAQCSTEAERNKMSDSYAAHREVVQRKLAPTEQEMPQHLCCQITWSILVDPVTTPSGISYERRALLEHLERGNKFEPVTREPLSAEDLYPNKMLADAVEAFCDEHPKVFFANI